MTPRPAAPAPTSPATASPIGAAPLPVLIGCAIGLVALGFVIGAGGSFLQARTLGLGVRWPLGALFAVSVLAAVGFSAGLLARSRLGLGMVAAGWVISVLVFTSARPEGDVIIAADLPGYLYLFGGVAALGVVSVVPFGALPEPPPAPSKG